jgi:hypothetical protein
VKARSCRCSVVVPIACSCSQLTISPEISETFTPMTRLQAGDNHGAGTDHSESLIAAVEKVKRLNLVQDRDARFRETREEPREQTCCRKRKGSCMHSGDFKPKGTAAR